MKRTWKEVMDVVRGLKPHKTVHVKKREICSPLKAGFEQGIGFPRGQKKDFRRLYKGDSMHVREFETYYTIHRDRAHPEGIKGHLKHFAEDLPEAAAVLIALTGRPQNALIWYACKKISHAFDIFSREV